MYALILIAFFSHAENTCQQTAVINLSFAYSGRFKLPGFEKDFERFQKYFNPGKGKALDLKNIDLARFPGGKQGLLKQMREAIAPYPNVQFNFTGHGIQPVDLNEIDRIDGVEDRPLPPVVQRASTGKPAYPTTADDEPLSLEPPPRNPAREKASNQFAILTDSCNACKKKCNPKVTEACRAKHGDVPGVGNYCWSRAEKDFGDACSQDCLQKYCITKEDLETLFRGKNVFGMIDACHSGALEGFDNPTHEIFASTLQANQKASDSPEGGTISRAMLEDIDPCRMVNSSPEQLNAMDLNAKRKSGYHEVFRLRVPDSNHDKNCYVSLRGVGCPGAGGKPAPEVSR